jgi:hypothetical protein
VVVGWGAAAPPGVHMFAPNFENVYESDRELHRRMQLVICKVRLGCRVVCACVRVRFTHLCWGEGRGTAYVCYLEVEEEQERIGTCASHAQACALHAHAL